MFVIHFVAILVLSALCDVMYTARLRMAKLDDHNLLRPRQNGNYFPATF